MIYYVLKCEEGMYYVGKTNRDLHTRFKEHLFNSTCSFTSKYKPISIIFSKKGYGQFSEDNLVKKYMLKYGINNVRGGTYSTLKLSNNKIKFLKKELFSSIDGCFKCGRTSHFANKCYAKKDIYGESLSKLSNDTNGINATQNSYSNDNKSKRVRSSSECSEYGSSYIVESDVESSGESSDESEGEDDMEVLVKSFVKSVKSMYNYFLSK